jgi:hypothetical protein
MFGGFKEVDRLRRIRAATYERLNGFESENEHRHAEFACQGINTRGVHTASHNGPQKRSRMAVPSKYWLISGGGND